MPDKTEPGNENKYKTVESVGHVYPSEKYEVDEIIKMEKAKEQKEKPKDNTQEKDK